MTPDPTTRDPAASLRACIDLAAKATPGHVVAHQRRDGSVYVSIGDPRSGPHAQGDFNLYHEDAAAMAAAVNFIRDDAPALLAERDELREALETVRAAHLGMTRDWREQYERAEAAEKELTAQAYRHDQLSRNETAAREAAEQVAREAVALLERASPEVLDLANLLHSDYGRIKQADSDRAEALAREIDTFTAHHGAGTGEGK